MRTHQKNSNKIKLKNCNVKDIGLKKIDEITKEYVKSYEDATENNITKIKRNDNQCNVGNIDAEVVDLMIKEEMENKLLNEREVVDESEDSANEEEENEKDNSKSEDEWMDQLDEKLKMEEDFIQETVITRFQNSDLLRMLEQAKENEHELEEKVKKLKEALKSHEVEAKSKKDEQIQK